MKTHQLLISFTFVFLFSHLAFSSIPQKGYPAHWWDAVDRESAPSWEILPQDAKEGEVILSKRNELGLLSNFAHTPFEYHGHRYESLEGLWQMMLFPDPDDPNDPRKNPELKWKHTRAEVAKMIGFEAKRAAKHAKANMKKLGIDWVSFRGKRMTYRSQRKGLHYALIISAMRAKLHQNAKVRKVLCSTGDLTLKPDHKQKTDSPPEWRYHKIYMDFRKEINCKKSQNT